MGVLFCGVVCEGPESVVMGSVGVVELDLACFGELELLCVEFVDKGSVVGYAEGVFLHALFEELDHLLFGGLGECDACGLRDASSAEVVDDVVAVFGFVNVGGLDAGPAVGEGLGVADYGGDVGADARASADSQSWSKLLWILYYHMRTRTCLNE